MLDARRGGGEKKKDAPRHSSSSDVDSNAFNAFSGSALTVNALEI